MKSIQFSIWIYVLVFLNLNLFAQTNNKKVNTFLYDKISQNIYAYNLRHARTEFNGINPSELLQDETFQFFGAILPKSGQVLMMEIDTSNLIYPISNYKVFKIFVPGFRFLDTTTNKISARGGTGLQTNFFLVAADINNEYPGIKYISGQFYLTKLSYDFKIDLSNPTSCLEYMQFRMYAFKVKKIKYNKSIADGLLFYGYSESEEKDVQILLPKKDVERPRIIENPSALK